MIYFLMFLVSGTLTTESFDTVTGELLKKCDRLEKKITDLEDQTEIKYEDFSTVRKDVDYVTRVILSFDVDDATLDTFSSGQIELLNTLVDRSKDIVRRTIILSKKVSKPKTREPQKLAHF